MKSKLRHPIRSITEPYGKAGLMVAVLALVLATTGAAFAAAGLSGKQKKEVTAIAKKYAGKPGAPGAQGPAGADGKEGSQGPQGKAGEAGSNGVNGVSAEAIAINPGEHGCVEGGIEVKSAKPTIYVCDGVEGPPGAKGSNGTNGTDAQAVSFSGASEPAGASCGGQGGIEVTSAEPTVYICNGSPWTASGTLPSGSTETGAWAVTEGATGGPGALVKTAISLPVPLAAGMAGGEHVQSNAVGFPTGASTEEEEHCPGSVSEPKAKKGFLCVYAAELTGSYTPTPLIFGPSVPIENFEQAFNAELSVGTSGAMMAIIASGEQVSGSGDWAVTAP